MTQLNAQQALTQAERFLALGNYPQAIGISAQLAANLPDQPASRILHGSVLNRFERYAAAMAQFEAGYEILSRVDAGGDAAIEDAVARNRRTLGAEHARALTALGRPDEALDVIESVGGADADPRLAAVRIEALLAAGRGEEAGQEASALLGEETSAEVVLAAVRVALGAPGAIEVGPVVETGLAASKRVGVKAAVLVELLRALGDLLDREARYEEAWTAYRRASSITSQPFDTRRFLGEIGGLMKAWTPEAYAKPRASEVDASRAVLVAGLPTASQRNLARMLGAHPDASSAGRIDMVREVSLRFLEASTDGQVFLPREPGRVRGAALEKSGKHYVRRLEERVTEPGATAWVDAQPVNSWYLPVVAWIMRGAKVVRVRETGLRAALGLYTHASVFDHLYAADLASCAAGAAAHERLVAHWGALLADERTPSLDEHVVDAERLATEPEAVLGEVLAFCGLDASEDAVRACLGAADRRALDPANYESHLGEAKSVLSQLGG